MKVGRPFLSGGEPQSPWMDRCPTACLLRQSGLLGDATVNSSPLKAAASGARRCARGADLSRRMGYSEREPTGEAVGARSSPRDRRRDPAASAARRRGRVHPAHRTPLPGEHHARELPLLSQAQAPDPERRRPRPVVTTRGGWHERAPRRGHTRAGPAPVIGVSGLAACVLRPRMPARSA